MTTEENPQPASNEPVGKQLQKAREKAGLSVNDVAGAQHLRPSIIQAIEAGEHGKIDSELFLKGYVRAYARQVGLDADAVISDLDRELEPLRVQREQEQEANPLVDIERRRRRKRQVAKVLFFLAVLGIAGYLVFAFVLTQQAESPATSASDSAPAQSVNESVNPESETQAPEPVQPENEAMAQVPTEPEPVAEPEPEPALDQEPAVEQAADSATDSVQSPLAEAEPARDQPVEPEVAVAERAPAVAQTPEPVLANPGLSETADAGRLEIVFEGDCWVQVSDSEGNRLVNSLQRNGDRIDVSGPAPLRVVIGAVDAVESIRFQGEPVDISGFRVVNNRTEFTLTI